MFRTASDDYCLTEEKCQIFIKQIVRGLQFIHSKNIIHLDLKPFNVIFANPNDDHNLRIIDFGLAEQLKVSKSIDRFSTNDIFKLVCLSVFYFPLFSLMRRVFQWKCVEHWSTWALKSWIVLKLPLPQVHISIMN